MNLDERLQRVEELVTEIRVEQGKQGVHLADLPVIAERLDKVSTSVTELKAKAAVVAAGVSAVVGVLVKLFAP